MAESKTVTMGSTKALNAYFNQGEGKRPMKEFAAELKELSKEEKEELARLAAKELGATFTA
jgi:hypothetical protein